MLKLRLPETKSQETGREPCIEISAPRIMWPRSHTARDKRRVFSWMYLAAAALPIVRKPERHRQYLLIIVFEQERSPENQPPRSLTGAECPRRTGPKPASKQEAQDLFSWEQNAPSSSCRVRQQAADAVALVQSRSLRLLWPKARPREETQRPSVKTFRRSCASP